MKLALIVVSINCLICGVCAVLSVRYLLQARRALRDLKASQRHRECGCGCDISGPVVVTFDGECFDPNGTFSLVAGKQEWTYNDGAAVHRRDLN